MKEEILSRVTAAVKLATKYRDSFSDYSHLWTDNKQDFLTQFLVYGHVPTQVRTKSTNLALQYPSSLTKLREA